MKKRPNILLVILDATRVDACSCYGCPHLTTPALDEIAREGVLFEQAISSAPWTLPAFASIFTGLYPGQIGIYERRRLRSDIPTLATLLLRAGYATFLITNNSWLSADFGLQQGFQTVHRQWQCLQTAREINSLLLMERATSSNWTSTVVRELKKGSFLVNATNAFFTRTLAYRRDQGASRILRPVARWIKSQKSPWFACVHYLESHLPYKPPVEWVRRFAKDMALAKRWLKRDHIRAAWRHMAGVEMLTEQDLSMWHALYLAETAYADYHLGQLMNWLRRTGRLDNTVVVVVADHGENLGEHGLLDHQYCIYDTLLHVPMVIRYPALLPRGQRITYQVQTLDIFRTLLGLAGVPLPEVVSGHDLILQTEGRPFTVAEYGVPRPPKQRNLLRFGLQPEHLDRFRRGFIGIRTSSHKLIVASDGSRELYRWPTDPTERLNLASQRPDLVSRLEEMIAAWQSEHQPVVASDDGMYELDSEVAARLRSLGYME